MFNRHTRSVLLCTLAIPFLLSTVACSSVQEALKGLDRPTASVKGASLRNLDPNGATLDFDVEVTNPYSVALPLVRLDYGLASRGAEFLNGQANLSGTVPARGKRTISVPTTIAFRELLDAVAGVKPGDVVPYNATLALGVDAPGVGAIDVPLNTSGEVPVPAVPDVRLGEVTWDELSLNRAAATMRLDILNTNSFQVDLTSLATTVSLGGRQVGSTNIAQALSLSGGESGSIEMPLSFSPLDFGLGVLNMLRGQSTDYSIQGQVGGATPFGPVTLPFAGSGNTSLSGG